MSSRYIPHLQILAAFIIWSFVGVVVNISSLSALQTLWIISLVTCISIPTYFLVRRNIHALIPQSQHSLIVSLFFVQGLLGIAFFESVSHLPIGLAVLITNLSPVFAVALAPIILREKVKRESLVAMFSGFIGLSILIDWKDLGLTHLFSSGITFALGSALFLSLHIILYKKLTDHHEALTLTFWGILGQLLLTTPFVLGQKWNIDTISLVLAVALGSVGTFIPFSLYASGLSSVPAVTAAIIGYSETFFSYLWGFLLLHQGIDIKTIIGAVIIFGSTYYATKTTS